MKPITIDVSNVLSFIGKKEMEQELNCKAAFIRDMLKPSDAKGDQMGWMDINKLADDELVSEIIQKASEIREKADVFVLIGVGGSNQGARAVEEAIGDGAVKIIYTGNTLSPHSINKMLSQLKGKSVYVNIIAKNFATLEPGIAFRVIRHYMEETYGVQEAAKRIIATGSLNNSSLEVLGRDKGYTLLPFPLDVGGRFSVLSAVGLLPIAVAGVNIRELLKGAGDISKLIHSTAERDNVAVLYALCRNVLLSKGYHIEIFSCFEPLLNRLSKWWIQLFGESEGKDGKGIFPSACSFTEDLHSMGQYIQEGQRIIFETFINLEDEVCSCAIPHEEGDSDGFAYIDGSDFAVLNKTAYEATVKAHVSGGVPCMSINVPELSAYYMGQLFYFFEYACYISGSLLGVNPFDQPGVEAYKNNMMQRLREKI